MNHAEAEEKFLRRFFLYYGSYDKMAACLLSCCSGDAGHVIALLALLVLLRAADFFVLALFFADIEITKLCKADLRHFSMTVRSRVSACIVHVELLHNFCICLLVQLQPIRIVMSGPMPNGFPLLLRSRLRLESASAL